MNRLEDTRILYTSNGSLTQFINEHNIDLQEPKKIYNYGYYISVHLFSNCALIHKDTTNTWYGYRNNEIQKAFNDARLMKLEYSY